MSWQLNYTALSDKGLVRGNNEDSAYAGPHLIALADGMGGHAAGEVASQLMITHLEVLDTNPGDNDMLALIGGVADEANAAIAAEIRQRPETDGMGTTLTALMFNGQYFGLCHVGDSRGYRLRNGNLEQITIDDTYVQSLVAQGKLDPEDVSTHPQRSLILKAYTGRPVEPTLRLLDARPGDRLLLCSDGLSDPVTFETIHTTLRQGTLEEAAHRLIELALRSGGPDNVTVVIAEVVDTATLDEAARAALPVAPVTTGALLGEPAEETHPDTAAGRAAALRRAQTIAPTGEARVQPVTPTAPGEKAGGEETTIPDPEEDDSSLTSMMRWLTGLVILAVIAGLSVGGWWVYHRTQDNYYLSVNEAQELVIERGTDLAVLGKSLHSPYQKACLDTDNALRLVDAGETNSETCHLFAVSDLKDSARASLSSLPQGSYEEVTGQLRRLTENTLPVCPTVTAGVIPETNCRMVR